MNFKTYPGDLAQCFSVIHRAFLRDTKSKYNTINLNATSAYIILLLDEIGESSQNKLAKTLLINKGQITKEINRLLKLKFITKEKLATKRTTNVIKITIKGRKIIPKIISIRNDWWNQRISNNEIKNKSSFAPTLIKITEELIKRGVTKN